MCYSFNRVVGPSLTEKTMFEQRCEGDEGVHLANTWWKDTLGRSFLQPLQIVRSKNMSTQSGTVRRTVRIEQNKWDGEEKEIRSEKECKAKLHRAL